MATNNQGMILQHLRRAVLRQGEERTDGQLLERFVNSREAAALAVLVQRHGPMVWGVCRRILANHHDAEDAFQATFLVLVRKAASVVPREMIANWLYGVAHQTALKARATTARRRARERQVTAMPEPEVRERNLWNDLQPLLDQELSRLPDKYRVPVVLCELEGKTRKEAARQLGIPEGTVASRLARARTLLAKRLAKHGLSVSGGALAEVLAANAAPASVPAAVTSAAIQAATLVAAGRTVTAAAVSAEVAALTEGVLKAMFVTKLKIATAVVVVAGVLAVAAARLTAPTAEAGGEPGKTAQVMEPGAPQDALRLPVLFTSPPEMKVRWLTAKRSFTTEYLEVPGRYSFPSGMVCRLKLSDIPNRPGLERYPTLEIPAIDAAAESFVSHAAVRIDFTDADFDRVDKGEVIMKVVYLPKNEAPTDVAQEPRTLASYDDPMLDVILEAKRRGTILAIMRMGNFDLDKDESKETSRLSQQPKAGNIDAADLQGTWQLATVEHDGLRLGEGRPENKDGKAVVVGKTLTLVDKDGRKTFDVKLIPTKPDLVKKPQIVVLTLQDGKEVFRGIYLTERGSLKLCFAREADASPTDFTADFGSKRWLYTFKRDKIEQARIDVRALTEATAIFNTKRGHYPENLQEMANPFSGDQWNLDINILKDPWGQPYYYNRSGPKNRGSRPDIWSEGPPEVDQRIGNWQDKEKPAKEDHGKKDADKTEITKGVLARVKSVDAKKPGVTLVFLTNAGNEVTSSYLLAKDAKIIDDNGKECKLTDLKEGVGAYVDMDANKPVVLGIRVAPDQKNFDEQFKFKPGEEK